MTQTEGAASVAPEVAADGSARNARILSGHKLPNQAVLDAIAGWKFPGARAGRIVQSEIEFATNCPR